jgi:hypothetical protein
MTMIFRFDPRRLVRPVFIEGYAMTDRPGPPIWSPSAAAGDKYPVITCVHRHNADIQLRITEILQDNTRPSVRYDGKTEHGVAAARNHVEVCKAFKDSGKQCIGLYRPRASN